MKYIIDLPDEIAKASEEYWEKSVGMALIPYTEPDRKVIEDEVWRDAWTMFLTSEDFGATMGDSYQEAKSKFEAWKKQKDEIHVGDEVEAELGSKACVLYENPDGTQILVFKADGTAAWWSKCAIHKTGRHFNEVEELLKALRKEKSE